MDRKIILASGSKNRQNVMRALNVPFEAVPADIDERAIRDGDLIIRAEKIARAKAVWALEKYPEAIIIAGDSFAASGDNLFEKPNNLEEAKQMLRDESGATGKLYTGFCYLDPVKNIDFSTTVVTDYKMREFSEDEIDAYVQKFPVLTWSGALFAGHAYGSGFVKHITGSINAFIYGFPTELVVEYLRKSGIETKP